MRGLLWIVALAGCAKQGGVQIAVTQNGTTAKTVELYVGAGQPTANATIVVDPNDPHTGTYWARDPSFLPATAAVSGGHADFLLEPTGGPIQLPIVIAVGYDDTGAIGAGELQAVDVPDRGFLTYDLPLTSGERLLTWDDQHPTTAKGNQCVAAGKQGKESMIVSPDDQDCDALTDGSAKECQPLVYKATTPRPAVPDEFTCFGRSSSTTPPVQCFVGGPTCADGTGPLPPTATCPLSRYCTPAGVCACTSLECLASQGTFSVPHYDCLISTESTTGGIKVCKDTVMLPAGSGSDCTNVRLRNPQQNFLPTLAVDTDRRSLRFAASNDKCKIAISPRGAFVSTGPTDPPDFQGVLSVMAVDSVATPFSGFLVPVEFTFGDPADGCGHSECQINGNVGGTDRTAVCTTGN